MVAVSGEEAVAGSRVAAKSVEVGGDGLGARTRKAGEGARLLAVLAASIAEQSVLDPRHPDYDPVVARDRLDASMKEIVAREPHDPSWAPGRESLLLEHLATDMESVPGSPNIEELECYTSSCRLLVATDAASVDHVLGQYPFMMSSPTSGVRTAAEDSPEGRAFVEFYLLFPRDLRDDSQYRSWYRGHKESHPDKGR